MRAERRRESGGGRELPVSRCLMYHSQQSSLRRGLLPPYREAATSAQPSRKCSKFAVCRLLRGSRARDRLAFEEFLNSNGRLKIIDSARPARTSRLHLWRITSPNPPRRHQEARIPAVARLPNEGNGRQRAAVGSQGRPRRSSFAKPRAVASRSDGMGRPVELVRLAANV